MQKLIVVNDISFYQDNNSTPQKPDFNKMKSNGSQGVIIRVGQGSYLDEDFFNNFQAASGILPRGVYWFYDSRVPPLIQAKKFTDAVLLAGRPEMEVWADYEENYGGPYQGWKHFAVFLAEVEKRLPYTKLGIYTGYYYWQSHCPNWFFQSASFNWFARFPLWLAWYTNNDALVKIPSPWKSALYWQFSSHGDGLASGVESLNIDCSYFQGTQKEFNERYSTSSPIPPPVIVPPVVTPPVTTAGLYRVKHDFEKPVKVSRSSGWKPGTKLRGLPETVRLMGGRGSVLMSVAWTKHIQKINTPNGYRYVQKEKSGWTNAGPFPRVECLTFGGNIVEVTKIVGNKAYVKTYFNNQTPPPEFGPLSLVQRFSVVYNDGTVEMATPVGNVYTVLIANPGEELWIDTSNLVKI